MPAQVLLNGMVCVLRDQTVYDSEVMNQFCVICGDTNIQRVVQSVQNTRFQVDRCLGCSLEFLSPQPSWEEIKRIYSADYYASWDMTQGENPATAKMKRLTFKRRLDELRRFVKSGNILDIGTATGFFLDEVAMDAAFVPYGVEVSEYAGKIAQEKFGVDKVHIGIVETHPFQPESFAAVTMSDLIEHVQDPRRVLHTVYSLLQPGGVAMIMTPDSSSLTHNLMGSRWTHYKLEHLYYFSPEAMRKLAVDVGFEVLDLRRARKVMTLKYLRDQLAIYQHPVLTPLSRIVGTILSPLELKPFPISMGEMLVFLRKPRRS